jgi:hypothetical protein
MFLDEESVGLKSENNVKEKWKLDGFNRFFHGNYKFTVDRKARILPINSDHLESY